MPPRNRKPTPRPKRSSPPRVESTTRPVNAADLQQLIGQLQSGECKGTINFGPFTEIRLEPSGRVRPPVRRKPSFV